MSHIGTFEKTGSANSILGSFVQVKKSRDGAQLRKPKKVSIKTVNVYANGSARSSTSFAPVSSVDKGMSKLKCFFDLHFLFHPRTFSYS